jgi:DeoR family transcriptional regulator, fructose operon transcriptional repressor
VSRLVAAYAGWAVPLLSHRWCVLVTQEPLDTALPEERRLQIAAQLRRESRVRVDDLARRFGVSGETVRRDLQVLEERGLLRRVYGGAVVAEPQPVDAWLDEPAGHPADPVRQLAALAATIIEPTDTLMLFGDLLIMEAARALPASFAGRVLCASLPIGAEVAGREGIEVLMAGGQLRSSDMVCSGTVAEHFFRQYFADKAFLSAGGVHPKAGLTDRQLADIALQRVILDQAREVYVLADAARIGKIAVGRVAGLSAVTAVITDGAADQDEIRALEQAGVKVLVASPDPTD